MSQAKVFSVIGSSVSRIQSGQPSLRTLSDEVQVVVVGVGRIPAEVQPGLAGGAVGGAQVGDVEPGDLGRQVGGPVAERDRAQLGGLSRVGGGQLDAVLDEPARRRGDSDARSGSVCSGDQVGPGLVGLADVAGAGLERDRRCPAGRSARQLIEPNRLTSLVSWTSETSWPLVRIAAARAGRPRRGRRCRSGRPAVGLGQQGEDLAVIELGDRAPSRRRGRGPRRAGPRARCRPRGGRRPRPGRGSAP